MNHIQRREVGHKSNNGQKRSFTSYKVSAKKKKKDMIAKEIHEDIVKILAQDSLFYATMKKWATELKRGRDNTEYDTRSDGRKTSTTNEQVDAIHCVVLVDRYLTFQQIA